MHAPPSAGRAWVLVGGLAILGLCLAAGAGCRKPPTTPVAVMEEEPGLPTSPYRNTAPGVAYVGDATCAECHKRVHDRYRQHPMGRSAAPVAALLDKEKVGVSFQADGAEFRVERRGDRLVHQARHGPAGDKHRPELDAEAEVQIAIGSGRQGRTYLVNRDGFLFQSPVSWYAARSTWGLSPGYAEKAVGFTRPITPGCLFCHVNSAAPVADTVNRYDKPLSSAQAIGCERCHGPGALHVESPSEDGTIVNPARLEPALRDAVCQQCHLQGKHRIVRRGRSLFDYRPGLPFHAFVSVFVLPPEMTGGHKSVSHVEQMQVSRCFTASRGKLGCISCHDPHGVPAEEQRVSFYRDRCLKCHQETSCPAPRPARQEKGDSCIACHMPRGDSSNISHAAVTDHRPAPARPAAARPGLRPGEVPLVHFHRELVRRDDKDVARDLGVAMMETGREPGPAELRQMIARRALPLLKEAVERHADDVDAWIARGHAERALGRGQEALEDFAQALRAAPRRETALKEVTEVATELTRLDAALEYGQRLVAVNPWQPLYRYELAKVLAARKDWARAIEECRAALKLDPPDVPARVLLIVCLAESGDKAQARQEFDKLLALNPRQIDDLRRRLEPLLH